MLYAIKRKGKGKKRKLYKREMSRNIGPIIDLKVITNY